MSNKLIFELFDLATITYPVANARIVACVTNKRGIPIAFGTNQRKSNPIANRLLVDSGKPAGAMYLHAEMDAILKALRRLGNDDRFEEKGITLFVARAKRTHPGSNFVSGLALPCKACTSLILRTNISKVVFTTNAEDSVTFETWRL